MKHEFKYNKIKRWGPIIYFPFLSLISYGFFREAFPVDNLLYSSLCFSVAGLLIYVPFQALNHHLIRVKTNEKGILICKPLKTISLNWGDITEYGKYQILIYGSGVWCFYIKSKDSNKRKIVLGLEYYQNLKTLNNIIIQQATKAHLVNTERME